MRQDDEPVTIEAGKATRLRGPAVAGLAIILLFVGGFGVWGASAPISGAVIAAGSVVARGQNKKIAHLEGGIVRSIYFHEGARVREGDKLLELDPTQAEASLQASSAELDALMAEEARLVAERDGKSEVTPSPSLLARKDEARVADLLEDQRQEFAAKLQKHKSELAVNEQRVKGLQEQILGLEVQRASFVSQMTITKDEAEAIEGLFKKQLTTLERMQPLKRKYAELEGQLGSVIAKIGEAKEKIAEHSQEAEKLKQERFASALAALAEARRKKAKFENEIRAATDVHRRVVVRAPTDGIIVKSSVHTIGGVVAKGEVLIELLPLPNDLLVEVRIQPEDIDRLRAGQKARVRLPALDLAYSNPFDAVVEYVSADRHTDEKTQKAYFVARLSQLALPQGLEASRVYPGMQAEAYVVTEDRTFFEYVLRPIQIGLDKTFRER